MSYRQSEAFNMLLPEFSNINSEVQIMLTAIVIAAGLFALFFLAMHEEGSI